MSPRPPGRGFSPPGAETKALQPSQHEPGVKHAPSLTSSKKTTPCCEGEGGQVLVSGTWSPARDQNLVFWGLH